MYFELNIQVKGEKLTYDEFYEFCCQNNNLKFERTSLGQIIFFIPRGGETGRINSEITSRLQIWSEQTGLGETFDSSTGFKLPNEATRSPDVAWIKKERWDNLLPEEKKKFPPLCPDFILEIRSENDTISEIHRKMIEYLENGTQLAWIIDPIDKKVHIYRPEKSIEIINTFDEKLNGEEVLPGFIFDLSILKI